MSDTITLIANEWTVSATETVSKDEYEPFKAHTSISGGIPVSEGELTEAARCELKAKLLSLQKDLQETVERAAKNRLREAGREDWGVRNGDCDG